MKPSIIYGKKIRFIYQIAVEENGKIMYEVFYIFFQSAKHKSKNWNWYLSISIK